MRLHFKLSIGVLMIASLFLASSVSAQSGQRRPAATTKKTATMKPAPAPRHDISGTWAPANGPGAGIQANGVKAMPNDGKPNHQLPYTAYGLAVYKSHHALEGADAVLPGFHDDPRDKCEPLGFPRAMFYNLRETQILQNKYKIVILYEYGKRWRVIWTDGRPLPKIIEGGVKIGNKEEGSRYYGYSVGRWVNATTLVVDTVGMMSQDKVWLDTAGRPISDQAHIIETIHRVNQDRLDWSVTIDDPKMYTRPWVAMNQFPMKLENPHRDVMEQLCSPTDMERYNKLFGNPSSTSGK